MVDELDFWNILAASHGRYLPIFVFCGFPDFHVSKREVFFFNKSLSRLKTHFVQHVFFLNFESL